MGPRGSPGWALCPGHCPLVPIQRSGLGFWNLLPCPMRGWLLASFSGVLLEANTAGTQAHRRGPRRGATPLIFKQLPPRSRRLPCRRERGIRNGLGTNYVPSNRGLIKSSHTVSSLLKSQKRLWTVREPHGVRQCLGTTAGAEGSKCHLRRQVCV